MIGIGDLLHQMTVGEVSFYIDHNDQLVLFSNKGKDVPTDILAAVGPFYGQLVEIARVKWELAWRNAVERNESYRFFDDLCKSMQDKPERADLWLESGRSDEVCPKCRWDITYVELIEADDSLVRRCAACGFSLGFVAWRSRQRLLEAIRQVGEGIRPVYDFGNEAGQSDVSASGAPNQTTLYQKEAG
jgi:hypothetical protein